MGSNISNSSSSSEASWRADALEALKLDPAVLEARIGVSSNKNNVESIQEEEKDSFIEESVDETDDKGNDRNDVSDCSGPSEFEKELTLQKAALFSLAPEQYHDLLNYVAVMRLEREINQKNHECGFCKKNGKPLSWYTSHRLKGSSGRVLCPVLRGLRCPVCGATGDNAHTFKYCPDVLLNMDH